MRWLLIFALTSSLWAMTYYVSNAGSNANNGTSSGTSWAFAPTMAGCTSVCGSTTIAPGDIIQFNKGDVWRDKITPTVSGTAGNVVKYQAYGSGANPVINGSDIKTGWTKTAGQTVTYQITLAPVSTVAPLVWQNGAALTVKGSIASVDATASTWFYDGTSTLYIHNSDGTNPASDGRTYEVAQRPYAYIDNGKAYLTFDHIDAIQTGGDDTTAGAISCTGDHNIFSNFVSHDSRRHNFIFYTSCTNALGTDFTAYNSLTTAVATDFSNVGPNVMQNCEVYQTAVVPTSGGGLRLHGGAQNFTLQNCYIHDTYGTVNDGIAFLSDSTTGNMTFRWNKFAIPRTNGFNIQAGSVGGLVFQGNTFDLSQAGTGTGFCMISIAGRTGSLIINNTFYGANSSADICLTSTSTGSTIENNIIRNPASCLTIDATSISGTTSDYNDCSGFSGNYGSWNGSATATFAAWKAASSQDAHSISVDPTMTSPATGDFTLLAGSPAINAGLGLLATYQVDLNPANPQYPYTTVTQNSNNPWEVGAFVFPTAHVHTSASGNVVLTGRTTIQ